MLFFGGWRSRPRALHKIDPCRSFLSRQFWEIFVKHFQVIVSVLLLLFILLTEAYSGYCQTRNQNFVASYIKNFLAGEKRKTKHTNHIDLKRRKPGNFDSTEDELGITCILKLSPSCPKTFHEFVSNLPH